MFRKGITMTESSWSILALLRFVLAAIVLAGHMYIFAQMPGSMETIMKLGGKTAVVGFLIISGISIGHSYYQSEDGYFARRFLRIYPLYFVAVLSAVFLQYFLGSTCVLPGYTMHASGRLTSLANFFFLQGFATNTIAFNGPLWSLGVEVSLYLLVPFLMRLPLKYLYAILILSMAVFVFHQKEWLFGYVTLTYAWPWLTGFLIAARRSTKYILVLFVLGGLAVWFNKRVSVEGLRMITYSFVVLIVLSCLYIKIRLPKSVQRLFNYLGELSYPLYLFHIPLCLCFFYFGIRNAYTFCVFLLMFIIPINYLFDHWLKKIFWKPLVVAFSQRGQPQTVISNRKIRSYIRSLAYAFTKGD